MLASTVEAPLVHPDYVYEPKYDGVRALVNLHFVKPGKLDRAASRALSHLAADRDEADYDYTADIGRVEADEAVLQAKTIVDAARGLLRSA